MGLQRLLGVLAFFAILIVVAGSARPVVALSCALPDAGMSPRSIVADTEIMRNGRPFFESYDFAVTGTVTSVTTDEVAGSTTYGSTAVVFDVLNAYGLETVGYALVVSVSDPRWMSGYPFEIGQTYFVPLKAVGPQGQPNYSFLCDPITPMTLVEAMALPEFASGELLVAGPEAELVAVSTSTEAAVSVSGDEADTSGSKAGVGLVIGGSVVLLVLFLAGWVYSARRHQTRAGCQD